MNGARGRARISAGVPRRAQLNMENSGLPRPQPGIENGMSIRARQRAQNILMAFGVSRMPSGHEKQ